MKQSEKEKGKLSNTTIKTYPHPYIWIYIYIYKPWNALNLSTTLPKGMILVSGREVYNIAKKWFFFCILKDPNPSWETLKGQRLDFTIEKQSALLGFHHCTESPQPYHDWLRSLN